MNLITTNEAKCRDCYKCVRTCQVKAISIQSGCQNQMHARVIEESCIQDGMCTVICPQKAKVVKSCLEDVKRILADPSIFVAASIAPSFAAHIPQDLTGKIPGLLRQLGFSYVGQTAVGAELISLEYLRDNPAGPTISSACPVVVNLVERHYPHLVPYLSRLVSPMIAHGRLLKKQFPQSVVVFIGPCIGKKGEAQSDAVQGSVDYVLGFKELWDWAFQEGIDLEKIPDTGFDGYNPGPARLFPAEGGQLLASSLSTDIMDEGVITISGLSNCLELLKNLTCGSDHKRPRFMELLACDGGCLGGPYHVTEEDVFLKKQRLLDFYTSSGPADQPSRRPSLPAAELYRTFKNRKQDLPVPTPEQIKKILALTDKFLPEDELNCGACGFSSCQEKAVAVFQGNAEPQMCIPYMRKRAESISNMVLRAMPDGVIITDEDLNIIEINPAARKMFACKGKVTGENLDSLMDPAEFQRVIREKRMVKTEACYLRNPLITRHLIFPLDNRVVGIFIDITNELKQREELELVKTQTINRAREVIKKQMTVAQVIAGLLGETTAETKALLSKLIKVMQE